MMRARLAIVVLLLVAVSLLAPDPADAVGARQSLRYGSFARAATYWPGLPTDTWDLTRCDLVVAYRLTMSGYTPAAGRTQWTSVGVGADRAVLGWMSSGAPYAAEQRPFEYDLDDKFNLGAPGRFDEWSYDVLGASGLVGAPIGNAAANHGIWFDRTGVDRGQSTAWGAASRVTYATGGVYEVEVGYHALSPDVGTMMAHVNGAPTGFYAVTWRNAEPDYYPVGKSVRGALTRLRVFATLAGTGVRVENLRATGCR